VKPFNIMGRSGRERESNATERGEEQLQRRRKRERATASLQRRQKRERVAAMSAVTEEQRERASSRREWRKKKNDENPWSLDLETESGAT
jgi:hypothetical protein